MFHLARGFSDIGYHFVICNGKGGGDGEIEAGRPVLLAGAHAIPRNADSIGICLVGDFTKTVPTTSQLNSTVDLLIRLMEQFPMAYDRLLGHKDVDRTLCPGVLSTRELAQLVQREREKEPKPKSQYQYEKEALAKLAAKAGFNQPHAVDEEWRAGMIALVLDRLGLLD
jgi:N-acetyl-anhydromuramyl-L-alanine amidase AmpD